MFFSKLPEKTPTGFQIPEGQRPGGQILYLSIVSTPDKVSLIIDRGQAKASHWQIVYALLAMLGLGAYALYGVAKWALAPTIVLGLIIIACALYGSHQAAERAADLGPAAEFDPSSGVLTLASGRISPGDIYCVEHVLVNDASTWSDSVPFNHLVITEHHDGGPVRHHLLTTLAAATPALAEQLAHILNVPLLSSEIRENRQNTARMHSDPSKPRSMF